MIETNEHFTSNYFRQMMVGKKIPLDLGSDRHCHCVCDCLHINTLDM